MDFIKDDKCANIALLLEQEPIEENKVVLDIGNGGQTPYNLSDTKKIIIYDIKNN